MKQQDLWDALCGTGNQPWPDEALYEVEGLGYHEALKLLKMHQAGEELPSYERLREVIAEREADGFDLAKSKDKMKASKAFPLLVKAARRRAMAEVLGVTEPAESAALAREAGSALDRVAVAAKRVGVQLDLSRRGSRRELLEVATAIYSNGHSGYYDRAVEAALKLIAEVDRVTASPRVKSAEKSGVCLKCRRTVPLQRIAGHLSIHTMQAGTPGVCLGSGKLPFKVKPPLHGLNDVNPDDLTGFGASGSNKEKF